MIGAIVLAAGRSQRMGTHKLLLPFAGSSVIARVVNTCLAAPADPVIVVTRPGDHALRSALANRPVRFVENPNTAGDMLSSLRCGLRALPPTTEIIVASPADQPSVGPDLIRRMLIDFRTRNARILVPVHHHQRGHPLLFAASYRTELLTSYDGIGLRGLLQAHAEDVLEWPTNDPAVREDLDTPADYVAAVRRTNHLPYPRYAPDGK
jgi:molybdenum cofactor cytidylyltransferase